jgi:hypothetical protein
MTVSSGLHWRWFIASMPIGRSHNASGSKWFALFQIFF